MKKIFGITMIMALLGGLAAQAATITWDAATTVTSTNDISLAGTQVYGGSWGSTGDQTVNVSGEDIVFQDFGLAAGGDAHTSASTEYDSALAWYVGDTGSTAFNTVMDSTCFKTTGSGNIRLYLTGLTAGEEYQIQLFASDDRNAANKAKTQQYRAVDGAPLSAVVARGDSTSVIGIFTADAVTQDIDVYAISATESVLNAMNLRTLSGQPAYSSIQESVQFPDQSVIASQQAYTDAARVRYLSSVDNGLGQSFSFATAQTLRAITFQKDGDKTFESGTHELSLWIGEYDSTSDSAAHTTGATLHTETIDMADATFVDGNFYTINLSSNINLSAGVEYAFELAFSSADASHDFLVRRYYDSPSDQYTDGTILYKATIAGTVPFISQINEPDNDMTFGLHSSTVSAIAEASVDPEELSMFLFDPATAVTGTVDFAYSSTTNLDISITISDEQHPGSFSVLSATPQLLTSSPATLEFEFDNTVSNLAAGASSTGLVNIAWSEVGSGVTNTILVPISVQLSYAAGGNNNFNVAAGNWGDTSKWSLGRVPGTMGEDNARVLYGYTATVATNFTGSLPWTTIVQADSTLNIAADFLGGGMLYAPFGSGQVGTVNQSAGNVTTPSLQLGDSAGTASDSVYSLTGGELLVDDADISPSGVLDVNGGTLNINAAVSSLNTLKFGDSKPGGLIKLRSGTLTKTGNATKNIRYYMDIHVSGGTVSHSGSIFMDNSEFRVIGDQASILFTKYNVGQYSSIPGETVFEMGTNGISTIVAASESRLEYSTMIVDGSAYTGGSTNFILIDTPSLVSVCPDVTVTNFAAEYTAVVDQTTTNVTLTITDSMLDPIGEITLGAFVDGDLVFSWDTSDGQSYNVETNADLVYPSWGIFDTIIGDGGTVSFTNTPDQDQLFYKVTSP